MSQPLEVPLTPAVFFTLFALAGGDKHGYAIMQEARKLSDGSFRMGPATLYTTVQRLLELDLIVEVTVDGEPDGRRRTYRLTDRGSALLGAELKRVEALLHRAKAMNWKPVEVKP